MNGPEKRSHAEVVSLREYMVERIGHERELREANEKAADGALKLQASEYERRLLSLNHEHERTKEALAGSVSRELFDAYVREQKTALELALRDVRGWQDRADGSIAIVRFLGFGGMLALLAEAARIAGVVR